MDPETGRFTIGKVARKAGWSTSVVSQYLAGKYSGDNLKVERKLRSFLVGLNRQHMIGVSPIRSEATEQMAEALDLLSASGDAGVIFGDAGIGKTTGIALYLDDHPNTILITLSEWAKERRGVEKAFEHLLGKRARAYDETRGEYIVRTLTGSSRLVVVDNAHKASRPAIAWLIDFHDATGCPLALVGNAEVCDKIDDNAQRHSRVLYRREISVEKTRPLIRHLCREIVPSWVAGEVERCVEPLADADGRFRAVMKRVKLGAEFARKLPGLTAEKYLQLAAERQFASA